MLFICFDEKARQRCRSRCLDRRCNFAYVHEVANEGIAIRPFSTHNGLMASRSLNGYDLIWCHLALSKRWGRSKEASIGDLWMTNWAFTWDHHDPAKRDEDLPSQGREASQGLSSENTCYVSVLSQCNFHVEIIAATCGDVILPPQLD